METIRPSLAVFKEKFKDKKVVCLECGVLRGRNALEIYNNLNIEKLYLIDSWVREWESYKMPKIFDYAMETFKIFEKRKNVIIIRSSSLEFNLFPDNFFDFIYLDDNHTEKYVYLELKRYYPKVKSGGLLSGDNYSVGGGVKKAVDRFCLENNYKFDFKERKKAAKSNVSVCDWWIWKE